ncbi:glutathione S-transferase domain-containing protein [Aureobasidium sp. EXF-10727]|nr:glutathione S-transferase domain-containing protein [Aureobasidium sp. EXF-10727]KAI4728688.1 glutathione S-transferase domain-containing protein [Aureobasidium sp. EXF-10728]
MFTLISATPSPYARKVRIALAEKNIPFTLQTEVPWDSTSKTPTYNPLEKLPVLILDDGNSAVYESSYILEWLEAKYPDTSLLPESKDVDKRLFARKIEVVCDGICDALVLAFFEKMREEEKRSQPWIDRQMRKVEGGLKALAQWAEQKEGDFLVGNKFGLADIAVGSVCGYLAVRWPDNGWQDTYPALKKHWQMLEARPSFKDTVPSPQTMKDKVV